MSRIFLALVGLVCSIMAAVPPSFDVIPDASIKQNAQQQQVSITGVTAGDADLNSLEFFVTSSNKEIIPDSALQLTYLTGTTSTTATLKYAALAETAGTVTVTITIYGQQNGAILLSAKEFAVRITKTDMDCEYTPWGTWNKCSKLCNGGTQTRTRSVAQQPLGNGAACEPSSQIQTQNCNQNACLPPTINQIPDQSVQQDSGSFYVDLTGISAGKGEANQVISVKVESSNANLIRFQTNDLIYKSPATIGKLWFTPNAGQSGSTNVVVTVTDTGAPNTQQTQGYGMNTGSAYSSKTSFLINVVSTPVDCIYEWLPWSSCSASCGDGYITRDSQIVRQASSNGQECPSPMPQENRACYAGACPVDCVKTWSDYQACSVSCGEGTRTRYETIVSFPENGGQECGVLDSQTMSCKQRACPVDCVLEWSDWSECSKSCGGGTSYRTKRVQVSATNGGKRCETPLPREERSCNVEQCPGPKDCEVGPWTTYSLCDSSCMRSRHRMLMQPANSQDDRQGWCPPLFQEEQCSGENCPIRNGRATCEGKCGSSVQGGCGCDSECLRYGDCCSDYARFCQGSTQQGGCAGRCGGQGNGNCWCDPNCERNGDCCSDYRAYCSASAFGSTTNNAFSNAMGGFGNVMPYGAPGSNVYTPYGSFQG